MSEYKELLPLVKQVLERFDVRSWDESVTKGLIGDTEVRLQCHLNDLNSCDDTKLAAEIELATGASVTFIGANTLSVFVPPEKRPGTIPYRFSRLMDELEKRFPEGTVHRQLCSEPPESHMLREIDAYLAQHPKKMVCPRCDVEMVPGIAIDPKRNDNELTIFDRSPLSFKDVDLIVVMKCPACGHSDDGK